MRNWPVAVADLTGWRRYGLALLAGVLAAGALPPLNIVPLLIPAFVVLVWLIDGSRRRRASFAVGWVFGFGHFVAGLHWIAFALTADPERNFIWLIPFAVSGIPAGLAIFTGFATLATDFARQTGWRRVIALALAWTAAEWLRGHVLTGFPWNLVGYTWTSFDSVLQITSVTGIYGLGLITVAVMAMPASILADPRGAAATPRAPERSWMPSAAAAAVLALIAVGGAVRMGASEVRWQDGVNLRLVQANIPQRLKWRPELREANLLQHVDMSVAAAEVSPTVVIWPETASTFVLDEGGPAARLVGSAAPPGGVVLTGAPRTTGVRGEDFSLRNSLHIVDSESRLLGTYDKSHLVPFGEYLPLRGLLSAIGFKKVTSGSLDYSAGTGPQTLRLPGLPPFSPLICYEVIFPGGAVDPDDRPEWLLSLTNDAWFGKRAGPIQHFNMARVRAVEQGLPLVRAAGTGVSAVVDPYGRVLVKLGVGVRGVIDSRLPAPLAGPTIYARFGDKVPGAVFFLGILAIAFRRRPRSIVDVRTGQPN